MFVDDIENYRILVGSKDDLTGELRDVIIHENVPGGHRRTILAYSGRMEPVSANRMRLMLFDGEMHEAGGHGSSYRRVVFDRYTLELTRSSELVRQDRESRGDREMSARQMRSVVDSLWAQIDSLRTDLASLAGEDLSLLLAGELRELDRDRVFPDTSADLRARTNRIRNYLTAKSAELGLLVDRIDSANRSIDKYGVEIQKKYSIPFACVIFVLLGVPLGLTARRGSAGIALGISLLIIVVYYLFLVGGEQLADRGIVSPVLAMWSPNLFFGLLGGYLTLRSLHEGKPIPIPDMRGLFSSLRKRRSGKAKNRRKAGS
jgi:lipopolysaccharide export system permease protein